MKPSINTVGNPITARRAVGWAGLEIAARQGFQLLVMVVLARLLVPEDFALFALAITFTSIGGLLAESGMTSALVQRQLGQASEQVSAWLHGLVAGLLCYTLLWLTAPLIESWLEIPGLSSLLRLSGLAIPMVGLSVVPDAVLISRLDFRARARAELWAAVVASAAAVVVATRDGGAWSFAAYLVVAPFVRVVLVWWQSGWVPRGGPDARAWRNLVGFGANVMVASIVDTLVLRIQSILLARFGDLRDLGFYTVAQNVHIAPATFASQLLYRLGLPLFTRMATEPERLRDSLDRLMKASTLALGFPILGLALVSEQFIGLMFGVEWLPAAPILSVLAVATVFWPLSILNLTVLNALGRSDLFLKVEVLKKSIMVACLLAGLPWGGIGLAWAVLVSVLIGTVLNMGVVGLVCGHGVQAQVRALMPGLTALGLAFFTGVTSRILIPEAWALSLVVYASFFCIFVALLDRTSVREGVATAKEALGEFGFTWPGGKGDSR